MRLLLLLAYLVAGLLCTAPFQAFRSRALCLCAPAQRASEERVEIQLSKADMRNFDLGKTFDVVIAMLGTLMHLCDIDDAVSAFQSISRCVKIDADSKISELRSKTAASWVGQLTYVQSFTRLFQWGGVRHADLLLLTQAHEARWAVGDRDGAPRGHV